jgi:hypothetical protein
MIYVPIPDIHTPYVHTLGITKQLVGSSESSRDSFSIPSFLVNVYIIDYETDLISNSNQLEIS